MTKVTLFLLNGQCLSVEKKGTITEAIAELTPRRDGTSYTLQYETYAEIVPYNAVASIRIEKTPAQEQP